MKACIIGGWSEGYRHEAKLRQVLITAGFEISHDPQNSDVIIAHSAGFYFLPKKPGQQLLLIIDPPYWPGRNIVLRVIQHILVEAPIQIKNWGLGYWLWHRFWNCAYMIVSPLKHYHIWRSLNVAIDGYIRQHGRVLLLRDRNDAFCTPDVESLISTHGNLKMAEIAGHHDDLWVRPQPYIDLLLKEL